MLPDSDLVSALPLFLVLGVIGVTVLLLTRGDRGRGEMALFLTAFAIRFAASLAIYEGGLVEVIGDEDAQEWINGWTVKRYWELYQVGIFGLPSVLLDAYDSYNRGYMYFLAAVYYIWDFADPGRLVGCVVNGFAGAMTAVLVYRAAHELFDRRVAMLSGWLACLFPSLIIWSAQTIKEPIVILLQTLVVYVCLRLFRTRVILAYLLLATITIALLVPFRFYGAYLAAGIVAFSVFLRFARNASAGNRRAMTSAGIGAALLVMAVVAVVFAERETTFDLDYFTRIKAYSATAGGSSVEQPFDTDTPAGFALATVFGVLHVLFAPLPWQWTGGTGRLMFTIPEVLAWWGMFFAGVWPGLRRALRERFVEIQPVLLFLLVFGLLYGSSFGNVGLAYRHRAQLLPWLLILAAAGLEEWWRRRKASAASRYRAFAALHEENVRA